MKILHKRCDYCNKPFQTYDPDLCHCCLDCERKQHICAERIPKEEDPDYFPIKHTGKRVMKYKRQCHHCGTIATVERGNPSYGNVYYYCDGYCRIGRELYEKEACKTKLCNECGVEFHDRGTINAYCSEACREANKKTKHRFRTDKDRSERELKDRCKGRPVDYQELVRRSEVKRLNEEWKRLVKWK